MNVLFLADGFPPEVSAQASRTINHCKEWVKNGDKVTVITCVPNYPYGKVYAGYKNKFWQEEYIEGIRIIRVWSYMVPNQGVFKRTLDFISFSITSFFAGLFIKADIIVATSPQFFTALSGRTLAFWKRKPWIMEVRDLWPESITTVGALKDGIFIKYFSWQELRCYKSAHKIVVVTDSSKEKIVSRGIPANKIHIVKNGVDRELFQPLPKDCFLIKQLGIEGKTIIGYIGTHGMAHKLDFIMRCAAKLDNQSNSFHFLFLGDGAEKQNLIKLKTELGLKNVTMLDSVPKDEVKRYISILDICLVNLRKSELFTTVIPSKIFENAAMQIPILMGVSGEARELIEKYNAGICFEPENEMDFFSKLNLISQPDRYINFKNGCANLAADFDRKKLAEKMQRIIHEAI